MTRDAAVIEAARTPERPEPPLALLAELTHRCPLSCLYCSNPLELTKRDHELSTREWLRVFEEAAELGVLQLHLSGGEPLLRADLLELVEAASALGLYTNLITSGIGLSDARLEALQKAQVGSFQLSFQGADVETSQAVAGGDFWRKKLSVAQKVKASGLPFSVNIVLHHQNLHQVGALIELAASVGAERLELANTQYYGWALLNREQLLPSRGALVRAEIEVGAMRKRFPELEIIWIVPDYYADLPKPCMGGWGALQLTVGPDGTTLPCPGAYVLPGLELPSVKTHALSWVWYDSPAFNRFRGDSWMQEPCRSCPRKEQDFGGCRCQAMLLTGDAAATDPACILSPDHHLIEAARAGALTTSSELPQHRDLHRFADSLTRTHEGKNVDSGQKRGQ